MFCSIYQYHISKELIELSIHQKLQKYKIAIWFIILFVPFTWIHAVIHLKIKKKWALVIKRAKKKVSHITTKQLILWIVPRITNYFIQNRLSKLIVSLIIQHELHLWVIAVLQSQSYWSVHKYGQGHSLVVFQRFLQYSRDNLLIYCFGGQFGQTVLQMM